MSSPTVSQLSLAPLGAGDLIDRAVRLYRRHLLVLIQTAAPPVIVLSAGSIIVSISVRQAFQTLDDTQLAFYIGLTLLGIGILMLGSLFMLVVMGGATHTLVAHLLRNDPVTMRATYKAIRSRFWGLLVASLIVLFWIYLSMTAAAFVMYIALIIIGSVSILFGMLGSPLLVAIFAVITLIVTFAVSVWVFFFIAGRLAYVPQALLVEGRSISEALSRSFALARGNVRRLMATTLFTTFATQSASMILLIPLGWIGYVAGVDLFNSTQWPAWYSITYSVLGPLCSILLTPIWMLGLSLLYVDERVRHEGYDIELMASRQLGEWPDIDVSSPFGPALFSGERKRPAPPPPPPLPRSSGSVLNLS